MARRHLLAAMTEATNMLSARVVNAMPTASGLTRKSIGAVSVATPAGVLGVVSSSNPVASFIEFGTRPHRPPIEPLVRWAEAKLGLSGAAAERAGAAIARSIARRGTLAQRPFARSLDAGWPTVTRIFEGAAAAIARDLAAGSGGAR